MHVTFAKVCSLKELEKFKFKKCITLETIENSISNFIAITRSVYHDRIGEVLVKSENIEITRYIVFGTTMYLVKVTKVFKQPIIHYINIPTYSGIIFNTCYMLNIDIHAM